MFKFIRERILIDKLMGNSEAGILFWRFHFSCIAKKNRDNNSNNNSSASAIALRCVALKGSQTQPCCFGRVLKRTNELLA